MKTKILMVFFLLSRVISVLAQNAEKQNDPIKIVFNDSSARYVLEHLDKALEVERDSIWKNFEGYRITLVWHEKSSVPITWKVWSRGLKKFLQDTSLAHKSLILLENLKLKVNKEQKSIEKHILKYLDKKTEFTALIYFVAFTYPYAFCIDNNKIGIDITGDEWNFDTDCILNTTIHEIYHIGFKLNSPDYYKYIAVDPTTKESFIRTNYAILQSEGMATYVAFKALNIYPSEYQHQDYKLLNNDNEVITAISKINKLSEMAMIMPVDTVLKECWKLGVEERAYYVAGSYMAKLIEDKYGSKLLAELVNKGSIPYVEVYNNLVPEIYKIKLIKL